VCTEGVKAEPQNLDEPIDYKEALMETEEVQQYLANIQKEREAFIRRMLKKHLTFKDRILFFFHEKLSDYFVGKNKVKTIRYIGGYNNYRVGVEIYGEQYWMDEKEEEAY
jgi:hypothetical protein